VRLTSFLPAVLLAAAVLPLLAAEPPPGKKPAAAEKKPEAKAAPLSPGAAFPPGTVVAVYENFADARKNLPPNHVILTGEDYRKLLEENERLRKLVDRPRTRTPGKCLLKGSVKGGVVDLQAQFEFETFGPDELVRLGCGLGHATGITLDGKMPPLLGRRRPAAAAGRPDEEPEGFVARVEKPGVHRLELTMLLPLWTRQAGQGFTLDLPRAAVTRLEFDLPEGARDVRAGGKTPAEMLLAHRGARLEGALGAADRLELSWKSAQAASAGAVLAAEGEVLVQIEPRGVLTTANLTLKVLGGQAQQWRLLVPRQADVRVVDAGRVARTERRDHAQTSEHVIHLKEAGAEPLAVVVTCRQAALKPGPGRPTGVGPFSVLGAVRQKGAVLVSNAVADWHLELTPHGDLTRRGPTDEELRNHPSLAAAFRYGPGDGKSAAPPGKGAVAWLDLEAEAVRGQIKTRTVHVVRLATEEETRWRVRTTITVTPRWADVDHFAVEMPAGCEVKEDGVPWSDDPRVQSFAYNKTSRRVEFKLKRGAPLSAGAPQPFTVTVEGTYDAPADAAAPGRAVLALPRPKETIEQGGELTVRTPPGVELVPLAEQPDGLELLQQTPHERKWRCPGSPPERVEASWRPYHPPVSVASLADVTLAGREGKVRQELRFTLPENAPAPPRLLLRAPRGVANLHAQGGELVPAKPDAGDAPPPGGQLYRLLPADPRRPAVVLDYTFALPADAGAKGSEGVGWAPVSPPLVAPGPAVRGQARVRVWSDAGVLPTTTSPGWSEQNIEEAPGRNRLPVLVLQAGRPDLPLTLKPGPAAARFTVLLEKVLVRVEVGDDGQQSYHVGYRLSRLAGRHIDFELPSPAPTINLTASLDSKRVDPELLPARAEAGRGDLKGRLVRLRLSPELVRKPAVLVLSYHLSPDRMAATPVGTTLQAPRVLGEAEGVPTRWEVTAPRGWVVLGPEAGPGAGRVWGRRGWLFAPGSNLTAADLDRWLHAGEAPAPSRADAGATPTLVLWRDQPTLRLTYAPQQLWLVGCSLALVLAGLVLARLPLLRPEEGTPLWGWLLLGVFLVATAAVVLLWPTLAGQLAYGCQPGAAVLLVLGLVQWALHERYRRQIVFLPSFSRTRSGSSLLRQKPVAAGHGEPSTVDAPARLPGSSVDRR
jgi:hypothetical protein